jgi:hypothetical protein
MKIFSFIGLLAAVLIVGVLSATYFVTMTGPGSGGASVAAAAALADRNGGTTADASAAPRNVIKLAEDVASLDMMRNSRIDEQIGKLNDASGQ